MFFGILFLVCLALIPLSAIVGLILAIVKYKKCTEENSGERKSYKFAAVILGIVIGTMVLSVGVFRAFL